MITHEERLKHARCDRCGKLTSAKQNGLHDLYCLPHEWQAPLADQGAFCNSCIEKYSKENWLEWFKLHRAREQEKNK